MLVGPTVCEDMWQPGPPATDLALAGAELLVNISASPFHVGKDREREEMFQTRARDNSCFVAFCNAVGGQDELIFDGHSCVIDDEGVVLARAAGFEEALLVVDVEPNAVLARRLQRCAPARARAGAGRARRRATIVRLGDPLRATATPSRWYAVRRTTSSRCGSRSSSASPTTCARTASRDVVVGVSGGIDSALTAALAAEALGPERVHCVSMPSRYSSEGTRGDAQRLAESLGCDVPRARRSARSSTRTRGARPSRSRARARPGRGEPPGADPRAAADGALEQVRLAARRDREQVGALGRLRDALRRHGRRVRAPEGHVQDGRVPARALPERAGRPRADPGVDHRARRRAPSCATTSSTRTRCRPTPSSTRCSRPTSRRTARATSSPRTASTRRRRARGRAVDRAEYKRRQAPPGVKLRPKAFGRDRRTPITNRWRG